MNFRLTFILAILLALLALGLFWVKSKPPEEKKAAGQNTPLMEGLKVKSIQYLRDGVSEIKFTRDGDNWRMTEPVNAAVEKFRIDGIASTLSDLSYTRKFEPEATGPRSAESTGTAKPRYVIKITDDAGKERTVSLGKVANEGIYATLDGGKTIFVLAANPLAELDARPDTFRSKQVKSIDTSKLVKLDIKVGNDVATLEKTNGKWLISAPVSARANATVVETLVAELANIQAVGFSKLDKQTSGISSPQTVVTAYIDESPATAPATSPATSPATQPRKLTAITLQFGVLVDPIRGENSPVYASLADTTEVFTYNRESFKKLSKDLKDLRDPSITPAPVSEATDLVITEGQSTLSLNKKDGDWQLTAPLALKADAFAVSDYLGRIRDLRAIKFVDNAGNLPAIGLDPPQMKIEIAVPGQSQREVILIGKPETADAVTPLMRQGEKTVYLIQTADFEGLKTTLISLRDKTIENLNADMIRTIDIKGASATPGVARAPATTAPGATTTTAPTTVPALPPGITLEMQGTRWMLSKDGKSEAVDESKLQSLVSVFSPLSAVKFVDDKPFASGTPDVTVTISILEHAPVPTTIPIATRPATAPATGPATATAPATMAAELQTPLPAIPVITVDAGKIITRTLRLYKAEADGKTTWKAVWAEQSPTWTFEPSPSMIEVLTKEVYNADAPRPAPATAPAMPPGMPFG